MTDFHDVRLPEDIEQNAEGGPNFHTSIVVLGSGKEKRNVDWAQQRCEFDIAYGIQSREDLIQVRNFFYARFGSAYGFRFKDWSDYQIVDSDTLDIEDLTPQAIGEGDGLIKDFQIFKRYTSGGHYYDRIIKKPVDGTVHVYVNGSEVFSGFSVDHDTGIISFVDAPADGAVISVHAEFDVPVRFENDKFSITLAMFAAGNIPSINLIETKLC